MTDPKNVYIDLGAFDGDTVLGFINYITLFDDPMNWDIVAFEPSNQWETQWKDILETYPNVELIQKAAWIKDEILLFNQMPEARPYGSSVMQTKRDFYLGEHRDVEAIDFAEFLHDRYRIEDMIVIKMDIEGAEFPLIDHLIKTNADRLINKIVIEWHNGKIPEYTATDKNVLIDRLRCQVGVWR